MSISQNLSHFKSHIPEHVCLIAVSKTKPNHLILEAYNAGQRHFGENYIQELVDKSESLPKDIFWHAIGHLQSNKVKYIAPFVHLIHGVDSLKLLQEINKQAIKNKRIINCLLQIYIAKEGTKFGLSPEECENIILSEKFRELQNINIVGLMGMASNTNDEKIVNTEFASLNNLFLRLNNELTKTHNLNLEHLSMGMSSDYKIAIANGSTLIRIGSSIFGERDYNQTN